MKLNSTNSFDENTSKLLNTYSVADLTLRFQKELKIDVSNYYKDLDQIELFECHNTKYQFFSPGTIAGDGLFYEELEKFDWYYMPWKWEHDFVKKTLKPSDRILEVGSGGLGFVKHLANEGLDIRGLELNEKSVLKAKEQGLNVISETVQEFSFKNSESFDMTCSFQVLEHIADVNSFIQAKVSTLKKGGRLVICVPNNDSFIKYSEGGILNFPPHHMGRWNAKSLKNLEHIFPIKVLQIINEPLQDYHVAWFSKITFERLMKSYKIIRGINRLIPLFKFIKIYSKRNRKNIKGHSILAIFEKQ
jgi:2-polyprenyl-3-methyl-5-hydroxy-6-metoxy-1,4-benzoquinol methylase